MSTVLLASRSVDLARRVRLASSDNLTVISPDRVPTGPAQLLSLAAEPDGVGVVMLDVTSGQLDQASALDLAARFTDQFAAVHLLLISDAPESLALAALRAGVKDVMDPAAAVSELRWVLKGAQEAPAGSRDRAAAHSGRVITVSAPKGGVGKTTLATNLARSLAEKSTNNTVVVDLDTQFGDVAAALDLDPTYTLGDLLVPHALADAIAMKALLTKHSSGLHVAPGVKSPEEADALQADLVGQLLSHLKSEFRYVIVDTAPGLTELTLAALDHTTDLVLMTGLDIPGIRGLRKVMQLMDHLDLPPMTRQIVVNMADKGTGLTVADVVATLGQDVDLVLPRDAAVIRSTNQGSPIVESAPRHRISRRVTELASRYTPDSAKSGLVTWQGLHRLQVAK